MWTFSSDVLHTQTRSTARAGQVRRGKHPDIFRVSSDGCISRALFGSHCQQLLNETIRLPIDLSCISDKIVNRLAALTQPKTLANTKDRKDKILNKLYKRRVELDFSRKSGARGEELIAASLTCCHMVAQSIWTIGQACCLCDKSSGNRFQWSSGEDS